MKMKYSVTSPKELRELCIRENWFTCGSTRQYEKMFQMNNECRPLHEIALVIWICSDAVPETEIREKLLRAMTDYMVDETVRKFCDDESYDDICSDEVPIKEIAKTMLRAVTDYIAPQSAI